MTAETFPEWLARIVTEDDPANGGHGLLTLGSCPKCEGLGFADIVDTRRYNPHPAPCPACDGTGWSKHDAR